MWNVSKVMLAWSSFEALHIKLALRNIQSARGVKQFLRNWMIGLHWTIQRQLEILVPNKIIFQISWILSKGVFLWPGIIKADANQIIAVSYTFLKWKLKLSVFYDDLLNFVLKGIVFIEWNTLLRATWEDRYRSWHDTGISNLIQYPVTYWYYILYHVRHHRDKFIQGTKSQIFVKRQI